jgi:hypothetical protein
MLAKPWRDKKGRVEDAYFSSTPITRMRSHKLVLARCVANFMAALAISLITACGTLVTYSGPELLDSQVATVECYGRFYGVAITDCYFQAVDGKRENWPIKPMAIKVIPGRHLIEVVSEATIFSGTGQNVCAFEVDLAVGRTYRIGPDSFTTAQTRIPNRHYAGSVVLAPDSESDKSTALTVSTICHQGGGSLCRQTSDCVPHPSIVCMPQQGYALGLCELRKDASD